MSVQALIPKPIQMAVITIKLRPVIGIKVQIHYGEVIKAEKTLSGFSGINFVFV